MQDDKSIRLALVAYMWHAASSAHILKNPSNEACQAMIDRMVDIFLVANDGIVEQIKSDLLRAPTSDFSKRKRGWVHRLRAAVAAYCDSLYGELFAADAYVAKPYELLPCEVVLENSDCLRGAARSAGVLAKKRKRSLYGFRFFSKEVA